MRRPLPVPPKTHLPEDLPVLDTLPFFEAAARLGSFVEAGAELGVTAAAVAYRVKSLERHLGIPLFSRYLKGVRLNDHGRAYLDEVQQSWRSCARRATACAAPSAQRRSG